MLKIIAGLMAAAIGGIMLYAATRPDVLRISRSASIDAAPERIFPLINNLRRLDQWSLYSR